MSKKYALEGWRESSFFSDARTLSQARAARAGELV